MSNGFDAYHKWLSIPPHDQPPNHYRLLGLGLFESDPDVVAAAADRQMAHVQTYKTGPHSELSQKLLNEISAAKLCLLRPGKKAAYDEQLRQQLGVSSTGYSAAYANVGAADAPARPGAMAGAVVAGVPRGMPYSGLTNSPVAPPPPALPPPVTDAPPQASISTMTILIAAGVVAVLLLIGIVIVLRHGNARAPESSAIEKSDGNPGSESSNTPIVSFPGTQSLPPRNPASATQSGTTPGPAGVAKTTGPQGTTSNTSPPKPADSSAIDHGKKPAASSGSEVATTVPPGNHPPDKSRPDKTSPEKTGPEKTNPVKVSPVKPVPDPSLAGKAAVPDNRAIATTEQRLNLSAELVAVDLLDQAHKASEAAEIYVLLRRALDSAIQQGDAATAISAVDELARRFAVNSLEVRSQTLNNLQSHVRTSESLDALAEAAAALVDDATTAAQPDLVQHLSELSLTSARKSGNVDVIRKITLRIIRLRSSAAPAPLNPGP
jgi:hypothetical protein